MTEFNGAIEAQASAVTDIVGERFMSMAGQVVSKVREGEIYGKEPLGMINAKVLLVVDDDEEAGILEEHLDSAGHEVIYHAPSYDEAIAIINGDLPVDVAVLNNRLNGRISGAQLVELIRAQHPGLAIIWNSIDKNPSHIPGSGGNPERVVDLIDSI